VGEYKLDRGRIDGILELVAPCMERRRKRAGLAFGGRVRKKKKLVESGLFFGRKNPPLLFFC